MNWSKEDGMRDLYLEDVTYNPLILKQLLRSPPWLTPPTFLLCSHLEAMTRGQQRVCWECDRCQAGSIWLLTLSQIQVQKYTWVCLGNNDPCYILP